MSSDVEIRVRNCAPFKEARVTLGDVNWDSGLLSDDEAIALAKVLMNAACDLLPK